MARKPAEPCTVCKGSGRNPHGTTECGKRGSHAPHSYKSEMTVVTGRVFKSTTKSVMMQFCDGRVGDCHRCGGSGAKPPGSR